MVMISILAGATGRLGLKNVRKPGKVVVKIVETVDAKEKCSDLISEAMGGLLKVCEQRNKVTLQSRCRIQIQQWDRRKGFGSGGGAGMLRHLSYNLQR